MISGFLCEITNNKLMFCVVNCVAFHITFPPHIKQTQLLWIYSFNIINQIIRCYGHCGSIESSESYEL